MRLADTGTTVFEPDAEFPTFEDGYLPTLSNCGNEAKFFYLAAFETWVQKHLASWLVMNLAKGGACSELRSSIKMYHSVANTMYAGVPASLSIMYLTILELWVACDKSACHIHPLLQKFRPEVQLGELQCLVLPLKCQLERLSDIELYVQSREDGADRTLPSVFRDFGGTSTFAVQYFDHSPELQNLKSEIEQTAARARRYKLEELVGTSARRTKYSTTTITDIPKHSINRIVRNVLSSAPLRLSRLISMNGRFHPQHLLRRQLCLSSVYQRLSAIGATPLYM
jgi:hypothetical protein